MVRLSSVETSFDIQGRGCYFTLLDWKSDVRIRQKDRIQLRTPDGNILNTQIASVEPGTGTKGTFIAIGLPYPIAKQDIPAGMEIWLDQQEII